MSHFLEDFPMLELILSDVAGSLTEGACWVAAIVEDVFTVVSVGVTEDLRAEITCWLRCYSSANADMIVLNPF